MKAVEIFKDQYKIRAYDVGAEGEASIVSLVRMIEDIAGSHAIAGKVGIPDMLARGFTWVLSRLEVKFFRRPGMGEIITGETWPSEAKGLKACRDFHFRDEKGNTVLKASTVWLVIDLEKRRPVRIENIMDVFIIHHEKVLGKEPAKLTFEPPVPSEEGVKVPYSALDMNNHVNNIYYLNRAMDTLPEVVRKTGCIEGITINFISECFLGNSLRVGTSKDDGRMNQIVFRGEEEVCRIQSIWKV